MSNEVIIELSSDINVITAEINAYQRVAGEAIFEIGKRLKHVRSEKTSLRYGQWTEWCETIGMDRRVASKFIRIYDELGEKGSTSTPLGFEALYQIATLPPEQRDQPHEIPSTGESKTVDEMTVRELREVKKALKEAEQAKEQAEHRADIERRQRERLEEENEKLAEKPPRIETKTEYIEVESTPHDYEEIKYRLEAYAEKFGDIANYDEHITATHRQDMLVAVMSFSQGVREFIKRYSYMTEYKSVIDNLDEESKRQYDESVSALKGMADSFGFTKQGNNIIDAEYSEII